MKKFFNRSYVFIVWAITFALYFIVRYNLEHGVWAEALVKALPELLLLIAVFVHRGELGRKVSVPVILALVFSILGDTVGEFKSGDMEFIAFVLQIVFFIFAQISYTVCFIRHIDRKAGITKWTPYGCLAAAIVIAYLGFIGFKVFSAIDSVVLTVACSVYLCALLGTGCSAAQQKRDHRWVFVVGAIFFIFSDSIIAINTFVTPVPHSGLLIMSTYFVAQFLLNITLIPSSRSIGELE